MLETIGQIIGFLGVALNLFIFMQKDRKTILSLKLTSDVVWSASNILIGAYSAAAINAVGVFRECVFFNRGKKWADNILWAFFFAVFGASAAIITGKNIYCLFPAFSSALTVICLRQKKPKNSRLLVYPICTAMLVYYIIHSSYAGIIDEILTIASALIGYFLYDRKKEKT